MTNKFLISDTTLRSFIPHQIRKMNPILRQVCGFENFIITKDMQINLNTFRTKLVSYLQQYSVGRKTQNSVYSTISDVNYKEKVFPYGEFLHATIRDAAQFITCTPVREYQKIILWSRNHRIHSQ